MDYLVIIYLLGVPLGVMLLAKRWSWIDKVSPMTVLYAIGLLVANCLPIGQPALSINNAIGNVAVPLAIPMMLMGCNLKRWSTKRAFRAFASGFAAVILVTVAGFFLFGDTNNSKEFAQVCAVATGMYTGGMPNVGAIAKGVGMGEEIYLYLTSYDLIATGTYLVFVIFFGKRVFRKLLTPPSLSPSAVEQSTVEQDDTETKWTAKGVVWVVALTLAIAAVSYGLATLSASEGGTNMTVLILALTTLAIGASFLKPVQQQRCSFDMGLYCVYVFCLSIATACNVREMNLLGSLPILGYVFFVIFGSLVLQILFARLLKIDSDTVLVSSVSLINSPPFVPMVAALLGNKDVIVVGISIGLIGYVLGNYLGIGVFQLLMLIAN